MDAALVIRRDLAPGMRAKVVAVALAFAAGGCLASWLGLGGTMPFVRGVAARAPLVAFRPGDLIPLGIAVSLFAFAAMCLLPVPQGKRAKSAAAWRPATILLGVAAAGLVLALTAPPIGRALASGAMAQRGYAPCPKPRVYERRPPLRWHLPAVSCP